MNYNAWETRGLSNWLKMLLFACILKIRENLESCEIEENWCAWVKSDVWETFKAVKLTKDAIHIWVMNYEDWKSLKQKTCRSCKAPFTLMKVRKPPIAARGEVNWTCRLLCSWSVSRICHWRGDGTFLQSQAGWQGLSGKLSISFSRDTRLPMRSSLWHLCDDRDGSRTGLSVLAPLYHLSVLCTSDTRNWKGVFCGICACATFDVDCRCVCVHVSLSPLSFGQYDGFDSHESRTSQIGAITLFITQITTKLPRVQLVIYDIWLRSRILGHPSEC